MVSLLTQTELLRSLVLFLMLGSFAGLLMGVLMLWRPQWLAGISKVANSWVSTRQMARPVSQPINIDHWFYRHANISGSLLIAGAVYILYVFTLQMTRADLLVILAKFNWVQLVMLEIVLDTLVFVFISGAVLAFFVGLFLIIRPSMLRDWEQGVNQQLPLRTTLKSIEIQYNQIDEFFFGIFSGWGLY
jgi:hypothetical protein